MTDQPKTAFRNWGRWDVVVVLGFLLASVGVLVPIVSGIRGLAFIFPLGMAMIYIGTTQYNRRYRRYE